jgi:hypothetical protein
LTVNSTFEWAGSTLQVPVGRTVRVVMDMLTAPLWQKKYLQPQLL